MLCLVEDSLQTDPAGFFRRHYAEVYGFVSARTGASRPDVEDLVQEVFLRAWNDRDRFRGESSPLTWILAIARMRALDYGRKSGRSREVEGLDSALSKIGSEELPESILGSAELGRRIRAALSSLPPHYSTLLLRRYGNGQSIRQIAESLGESEAAVDSRLRRAREALRIFLQTGGESHEQP